LTNLALTSKNGITTGNNVNMTAGTLSATAPTWGNVQNQLLGTKDIVTKGALTITANGANGVQIGNGNKFINNGAKLAITAAGTNADVTMGNNNTLRDMGGNVVVLAKGNVIGGAGNQFQSMSVVKTASGVELGSGLTAGTLSGAFAKKGPLAPTAAQLGGSGIAFNNNGVILLNPKNKGTVNLVHNGPVPGALLTAQPAGAIVFDAMNTTSKVQFDGANITVHADKPIARTAADLEVEYVVDTEQDDASVEVLTQK
jgi:hypothetical protein